jgi:hypothetical protein
MTQGTINQRLNFLIENLGLSIRAFSAALGVSDTNTRNYLTKGTKPNSDYLESVLRHFNRINPTWLLLGEGEPFKDGSTPAQNQTNISGKKSSVAVAGTNNGTATTNNYNLEDCQRDRDILRAERDSLLVQVELLNGQLQMQKTIIEGKDQMLDLLKGGFNRPN